MSTAFDDLDKPTLATLLREYLLCGHLIDRAGIPHVLAAGGMNAMREVAIEEWMGASPVYTARIRKLLKIHGDGVADIFKAMQFDIGAPPQFMDFRYEVTDHDHGAFELPHCGALMDVEPMGDGFVVTMCHHIEDPTFDATAAATNPKARMRPVHRPPRSPEGRLPMCRWTVEIDDANDPLPMPEAATRIGATPLAKITLDTPDGPDDDGATDYAGAIQADVDFGAFSRHTLIALIQDVALQGHLLMASFVDAVSKRFDADTTADIAHKQRVGIAGAAAARIAKALGTTDVEVVERFHPLAHPAVYVTEPFRPEVHDAIAVTMSGDRVPKEVRVTQISTGADFVFEKR